MGTTRIKLYREALRLIKERTLSTVSDNVASRRALDEAYDDALDFCLEQGLWNHAARTVAIEDDGSIDPNFGYTHVHEKPEDFVRLMAISSSGDLLTHPLEDYMIEGNYIHSNTDPLYIQYVSNGASYGLDLTLWPQTFAKAVAAYLALDVGPTLTSASDKDIQRWQQDFTRKLRDARSKDAMSQASRRLPPGRLSQARAGNRSDRYLGRIT
jgi:hypothetical protein